MGYAITLRTGPNPAECEGIIKMTNHFYGHMEITEKESTYFCGIKDINDIEIKRDRIKSLCDVWFNRNPI